MTDDLRRLVAATRTATAHIDARTCAERLLRDASAVAEARLPCPIGTAVAAVLAVGAHERKLSAIRGSLGADRNLMALAVAVLEADLVPDIPDIPDESGA